jgi:prepilin-type N-terminal cleavage/methylation domain-containing protein
LIKKLQFTLVELLVVISVLAILMSLLFPSLKSMMYRALSIQCTNNQKQIVQGVMVYTNNNGGKYPASTEQESDGFIAPNIIAHATRNVNYREALLPYFENTLKEAFACPLAPDLYKDGAVRYSNISADIDTATNAVTSYSHYYGRNKSGTQDTLWGSGSVFFTVTKGMRKVGQGLTVNCADNEYDDIPFRMMTSDVYWRWQAGRNWTHNMYNVDPEVPGVYGESRVDGPVAVDFTYSLDDGSVMMLENVMIGMDNRITNTRDANRGWVMPLEALSR